jgi:hypothetical protein
MAEVTEWVEARDSKGHLKKDEYGLNYLILVTHKVMTDQQPYTITGLALYLDTSRETLLDYQQREPFSDAIKKAKNKVHSFVERLLLESNPTGPIFNLKNNFDWHDKTETEHSGGGDPITLLLDKYGVKEVPDDRKADGPVQGPPEGPA